MSQTDTALNQLIEQAACCFNMLTPADLSDAQAMEDILRQISNAVAGMCGESGDLRQRLEGATTEASGTLHQILQREVEDTAKALDTVSKAICVIQDLVQRITESRGRTESASPAPAEPGVVPAQGGQESPPNAGSLTISQEDAPLVLDFVTEANEHMETAESAMLELENRPGDNELINKIFRAFHTIKGMAGFLNLAEIQSLSHSAENVLDLARKSQLVLSGDSSDVIFESIDGLKKMLAGLKAVVESNAPVGAYEPLAHLLEVLKATAEGRAPSGPKAVAAAQENDKKLDAILEDRPDAKNASAAAARTAEDKVKVSTARLDSLVNLAGELVIAQLMVAEEIRCDRAAEHELARKVTHQGKIVRELQELSMSMRMVPVQGVFQKMTRLARDLSHKAGRQVDFVTTGEETELDRTVVDHISDPLIHMVRNAIDHGIEPPEQRAQAGKSPTGRVELRAFHQAGSIVIEMQDDGRGLNKERIVRKAVEQGLIEPGQELSEEEVFKLIFHPGLSTAEKVTAVSGRGVGMDVVKKNIELLRGRIDISSAPGKGTTFTIRLPLTLAVIDGQVVRIGEARYILPINSIVRSLRCGCQQISSVQNRGEMVLERGELMPLIRLYRLLNARPSTEDPSQGLIVVVEGDGCKCCLLVDDLLGQQQVVIKSLGEALGRIPGVSGGAIMGDGRVTLILDVPGLLELAQTQPVAGRVST
jgi:two-component system chemotaxis sensor kinase CheA